MSISKDRAAVTEEYRAAILKTVYVGGSKYAFRVQTNRSRLVARGLSDLHDSPQEAWREAALRVENNIPPSIFEDSK